MDERDAIVVKVGTGVLTRQDGTLDSASLARLVNALADLPDQGKRVILVSSGAVGAGISALGLKEYPDDVSARQAAAAAYLCCDHRRIWPHPLWANHRRLPPTTIKSLGLVIFSLAIDLAPCLAVAGVKP